MTLGVKLWSTPVKITGVDPQLVSGEVSGGGARRVSPTGDHLDGGLVLRVAGGRARLVVQVGGAGVAGAAGGELFCGCRSSGNLGVALQSTGGGVVGVYGFMRSC